MPNSTTSKLGHTKVAYKGQNENIVQVKAQNENIVHVKGQNHNFVHVQ